MFKDNRQKDTDKLKNLIQKHQRQYKAKVYDILAIDMKQGMSKPQIQRKYKQFMFERNHTIKVGQAFVLPVKRLRFWLYFIVYALIINFIIFEPMTLYQKLHTSTLSMYYYIERNDITLSNNHADGFFVSKHFIPWDYIEAYTFDKFSYLFFSLIILFYIYFVIIEFKNMPKNRKKFNNF